MATKTATREFSVVTETPSWWSEIVQLTKLRLTVLVLATTLAGFYLASPSPVKWGLLFHTLLGTGMVAAAASALNQFIERHADAKMRRTENRPLASRRVPFDEVVVLSITGAVIGVIYLACLANWLTAFLAGLTLVIYLFVYTPLKMRSAFNTLVGAIPGAIPPMIGWAAVRNELTAESYILFAILFLWQLPHFMAIAWLYRDDYREAGFKMVPLHDPDGHRTGRQSLMYALLLIPVSLMPGLFGYGTPFYLVPAAALSGTFAWYAWCFRQAPANPNARRLFLFSLLYLPLQLGLMAVVKAFS
jgi:protoheme IX farnesyltransferase